MFGLIGKFKNEVKNYVKNELFDFIEDKTSENEFKTSSLACEIVNLLRLEKLTTEELVEKYKYEKWSNLSRFLKEYLKYRLDLDNYHMRFYLGWYDECVGQIYDYIKDYEKITKESEVNNE